MYTCDLHTHSRFFHAGPEVASWIDPHGVGLSLRVARRRGIDGVAVTNHDFLRPETLVDDSCIPGIEISTTRGHLLVIGTAPPERTEPGALTPSAAVDLARENGCATVVAHPLRNSTLLASDATFDAVEINGKHPEHRRRIEKLAAEHDLPVVGGSDAHFPFEVGRVATRLDVDTLTPETVVTAIREGHVDPVFREGPLLKALGSIYGRIHGRRGHVGESPPAERK